MMLSLLAVFSVQQVAQLSLRYKTGFSPRGKRRARTTQNRRFKARR